MEPAVLVIPARSKAWATRRLTAEMAVRFADVLGVSTDDLLRGKKSAVASRRQPSLKLLRRMEQIENLPRYRQRALLTTIDGFLAAAQDR